jgi:hypothetical protein
MDRKISSTDRHILRGLAQRVAEIAALPMMTARRQAWIEHNSLRSLRPMMLIFPEGSWAELLPESGLFCQGEFARRVEQQLRMRIYTFEHFQDDTVVEAEWTENPALSDSGWGVWAEHRAAPDARGAWAFQPVIRTEDDLKKLHFPELTFDEAETRRGEEQMGDLFAGLLRVEPYKVRHISYHLLNTYSGWCGLEEMMTDFSDRPAFVHHVLSFLEEGHHKFLEQLIQANLLGLNNNNTYHSSGGNGYTDQLPAPGLNPARVRPADMWASAEAQELALVSPRMHEEFALQYERRLLAPFGLTGYGCCEDLSAKLPRVFSLPNLRRVSISPFANVERSAEKLQGRAIYSWKPHPSHLVGEFDPAAIRLYIRRTLDACRQHGCYLEMILKDTHTCENYPERFDVWTQVAREEIGES